MPDAWEYPWFAAWDLAYHCAALAALKVFRAERIQRGVGDHGYLKRVFHSFSRAHAKDQYIGFIPASAASGSTGTSPPFYPQRSR
ncbi:hypothetical protein [Halochromatium salexigens]|uniref:hypothetical protein n=1 Tax=Halochromatium salexigens TaxID=49447 RepID=UPI001913B14E|nr:hypothetical protein [Halochromatium salexigens]